MSGARSTRPEDRPETAFDQVEGVTLSVLNRADVSGAPGFETIVARLEVAPGAKLPRHTHPGDEHLAVIVGGELTAPDGTVTPLRAGTAVLFPAGRAHGNVRSTGPDPLVMIAALVLPKGAPFLRFVD